VRREKAGLDEGVAGSEAVLSELRDEANLRSGERTGGMGGVDVPHGVFGVRC